MCVGWLIKEESIKMTGTHNFNIITDIYQKYKISHKQIQ